MSDPRIELLGAASPAALTVDELAGLYASPTSDSRRPDGVWLRTNFVASVDGAATGPDDRSGPLSSASDRFVFGVLRRLADVVLIGAGTVRAEGYAGPLVRATQRTWREEHGLAAHPAFVIVSKRLDLDPASPVFGESPVRVLIATVAGAPVAARAALGEVAELVDCGEEEVDPWRLRGVLAERGLPEVLCEGGPSLHGALALAGAVDELCLTVSPRIEGGDGPRIAGTADRVPDEQLRLAHVLRSETHDLHLRYVRA